MEKEVKHFRDLEEGCPMMLAPTIDSRNPTPLKSKGTIKDGSSGKNEKIKSFPQASD
jgi:hypothetical protein